MNFQPNTDVYFCHTGIDAQNKVWCKTQKELIDTITNGDNYVGMMVNCSFQRADGYYIIRVDHSRIPYYQLLQCDTVLYNNREQDSSFFIVGNIVGVEWKNEECSFVRFVIDPFMTYGNMIDFDNTFAYVQREHVKEDWSGDPEGGGNPLFSNIGPAEDFSALADTPIFSDNVHFELNYVLIHSPYGDDGKPVFGGQTAGHMYSSLQTKLVSVAEANRFFTTIADSKDASINNIVGVYAFPPMFLSALESGEATYTINDPAINIAAKQNPNVPIYNNAKCWSAPYCNIRLIGSNGAMVDFTPQWFGNDISEYTCEMKCTMAGKQFGGIAGTFRNKNGIFDWKCWNDFTVCLTELPRCYWTADGFTDWMSYSQGPIIAKTLNSVIRTASDIVFSASKPQTAVPSVINSVTSMVDTATNIGASISQQKATGATINGGNDTSNLFDVGQNSWGFKIVYYMAQPYIMHSIDDYFDRFGYRINKLKKLELETRPIWNYIQTAECHVIPKTGIPIIFETQINQMFNNGVTIWNRDKYMSGQKIGDFSKAAQNRGIKGA